MPPKAAIFSLKITALGELFCLSLVLCCLVCPFDQLMDDWSHVHGEPGLVLGVDFPLVSRVQIHNAHETSRVLIPIGTHTYQHIYMLIHVYAVYANSKRRPKDLRPYHLCGYRGLDEVTVNIWRWHFTFNCMLTWTESKHVLDSQWAHQRGW